MVLKCVSVLYVKRRRSSVLSTSNLREQNEVEQIESSEEAVKLYNWTIAAVLIWCCRGWNQLCRNVGRDLIR